jgi:subtilisin family serine protease
MAERGQEPRGGRPRGRGNGSEEPLDEGSEERAAVEGEATDVTPPIRRRRNNGESAERPAQTPRTGEPGRPPRAQPRTERYLVAPAPWVTGPAFSAGSGPPAAEQGLIEALRKDPDVRVLRVVRSAAGHESVDPQPATPAGRYPLIAVVEMTPDRAMALAGRPDVYVDADHPLRQGEPVPQQSFTDAGTGTLGESLPVTFQVRDDEGTAVPDAVVYVVGGLYPVAGTTGADGRVDLALPADALDGIRGVYVRPRSGCWSAWLAYPRLSDTEPNVVTCRRLATTASERPVENWANQAMGFDRLPPTYRGHGVKIAVIGSGIDATHPDLAERVASGIDIAGQDEKSWGEALAGYGTHQAALIAGHDTDSGVVGMAPDAEIHICRVSPGGRFSDLIDALDYCIAHEIDVVDLGVGSEQVAGLVVQKIEEARQAGILCVAAAGDLNGPVLFPGTLPTVLAVGAVGKLGTYPPDSYHAIEQHGLPTPEGGYFAARFSGSGPEVDVCAPGVAVVSAATSGGYVALDGTAVASAYVAALAALVVAHHPDFRYDFPTRGPARVDRLAYLIKASCRRLPSIDPSRTGAGLPDAMVAVGLGPQLGYPGGPEFAAEPAVYPAGAAWPRLPSGAGAPPEAALDTLAAAMYSAGLLEPVAED